MHKLETLRDTLCEELEKVAKKESISTSDLDTIDKLAHSIKNIDKILGESSYEYNRGSYGRGYGSYGRGSYEGSYARRGRDGDNDGRYNEGRSRDGYSRDEMTDRLRRMMSETSSDRERDVIMRCISKLENE